MSENIVTGNFSVLVYERDGTEHETTHRQMAEEEWGLENGYVIPPEDHICKRCMDE